MTHRVVALVAKLSHHLRIAARRQLVTLYRMLLSVVNPDAAPSERLVKRKGPQAAQPTSQVSEEADEQEECVA